MTAVATSHQPPVSRAASRRDRGKGWWGVLPSLRLDETRCWLPLSDRALVGIGLAIQQADADGNLPPMAETDLARVMIADPPLFLFLLVEARDTPVISISELAQVGVKTLMRRCASGEWMLAAPSLQATHQHKWSRLMAQSQMEEPSRWPASLMSWLRVLTPGLPDDACPNLPRVLMDVEDVADPDAFSGARLLQQIVHGRRKEQSSEKAIEELANERKMSAAKQLAYGLSHEINNPLANISARAQALGTAEVDPNRRDSLDRIVSQVYRAHEMIAGLMFFANPPEPREDPVDLCTILEGVADEFGSVAASQQTAFHLQVSVDQAWVRGDASMLLEAVRVLMRNSIEAVGEGGTIVLSLDESELAVESSTEESSLASRKKAPGYVVHVADSGPGLSREQSRHAFDPFFSGREAGRGLGLGLCRAYRVAKLHNATVHLRGGLAGCVATFEIPALQEK